jgi:hypothetical protein
VTWNLKKERDGTAAIAFLDNLAWDIACLQEVNRSASAAIANCGWSALVGLDLCLQLRESRPLKTAYSRSPAASRSSPQSL